MDYDSLLDLVKKRRSIRRFKADPIPDDYITKIIDVARWAPSGFNMQPWEFLVVKKPELRERIVELISDVLVHGLSILFDKIACQQRNIGLSLPQGGKHN